MSDIEIETLGSNRIYSSKEEQFDAMRKPFRLLSSVWVSEIQIKLCKPWRWEKKLPDRRFGTGGRFEGAQVFPSLCSLLPPEDLLTSWYSMYNRL